MIGTKILVEKDSKYNGKLKVVKSWGFGTYIQSDGLTQSGGVVDTIWMQTIKRLKKRRIDVKNCLILGLGGGTVATIIRKNWPTAKIIGIEIDPIMIELGKKYLGLNDLNIDIKIADASTISNQSIVSSKQLISLSVQQFDLIIVDLYHGDKSPKKFETKNYIQCIRTLLAHGGIAVFNRLHYGDKIVKAEKFEKLLMQNFDKVERFYPSANVMFFCSSIGT